jgi:hypothetical protein
MYCPVEASQRIVLPLSAALTDLTASFTTSSPAPEYMPSTEYCRRCCVGLTAAGSEIVNCSPTTGSPLLFGCQNSHSCGSSAAGKVYGTIPRPGKYSARLSRALIGIGVAGVKVYTPDVAGFARLLLIHTTLNEHVVPGQGAVLRTTAKATPFWLDPGASSLTRRSPAPLVQSSSSSDVSQVSGQVEGVWCRALPDRWISTHRLVAGELGLEHAFAAGQSGKLTAKILYA